MSRFLGLCAVIVCAALAHGDDAKGKKDTQDKKPEAALEGAWNLVGLEQGGAKQSEADLKGSTLTFKENRYIFKIGKETEEGTFKVDSSKKPNTLDLAITTGEDKGKQQLGLVEITGDTLKICVDVPGATNRPKELKSPASTNVLLFVFKKMGK